MQGQGYIVERSFTIPAEAFDEHGVAHFTVCGGSAGGWWRLSFFPRHVPVSERRAIGSIGFDVKEKRRPDLAAEMAQRWVEDLGRLYGLQVIDVEDESLSEQAPYSISYHFTVQRTT